jgi:hypothetical protein
VVVALLNFQHGLLWWKSAGMQSLREGVICMGTRILPIYKGHFVDARLRQFHLFKVGELPSIIPFESEKGREWLAELREHGFSTEPVPVDSPEGQKRLEEFKKLNVHGS